LHFRTKGGVDDGDRTHDNRDHNPGLYQLSYVHHRLRATGAPGRTRTCDPRLRRPMLYPPELRAPFYKQRLVPRCSSEPARKSYCKSVCELGSFGGFEALIANDAASAELRGRIGSGSHIRISVVAEERAGDLGGRFDRGANRIPLCYRTLRVPRHSGRAHR
jgi:hypothetical protein